jgi:hypothetical protein
MLSEVKGRPIMSCSQWYLKPNFCSRWPRADCALTVAVRPTPAGGEFLVDWPVYFVSRHSLNLSSKAEFRASGRCRIFTGGRKSCSRVAAFQNGDGALSTRSGLSDLREADVRDVRSAAISGPSICCSLNLAFFTASSRLYANLDFEGIIGWETEGQAITHPALSHGGETK